MNLENLRDIFQEQLKDMYSAEKQFSEALPTLIAASSSPHLKEALETHHETTKQQLETVRQMLDSMDVNPGNTKCEAMEGLVKEARGMASKDGDSDARDAGIVCAVQKAEHYEIATYGSLRTWAILLGEHEAAESLQALLNEEYSANDALNKIAEGYINQQATS